MDGNRGYSAPRITEKTQSRQTRSDARIPESRNACWMTVFLGLSQSREVSGNTRIGSFLITHSRNIAVGDFTFKLPAIYTERVFLNSHPSFVIPEKIRGFIGRNITPPYMSGVPDIQHVNLKSLGLSEAFLIMCTDGLMDLDEHHRLRLHDILSKRWVNIVGEHYREQGTNLALWLLREALGGSDSEKVSRMITVEMAFRWMDDTTVLVIRDL